MARESWWLRYLQTYAFHSHAQTAPAGAPRPIVSEWPSSSSPTAHCTGHSTKRNTTSAIQIGGIQLCRLTHTIPLTKGLVRLRQKLNKPEIIIRISIETWRQSGEIEGWHSKKKQERTTLSAPNRSLTLIRHWGWCPLIFSSAYRGANLTMDNNTTVIRMVARIALKAGPVPLVRPVRPWPYQLPKKSGHVERPKPGRKSFDVWFCTGSRPECRICHLNSKKNSGGGSPDPLKDGPPATPLRGCSLRPWKVLAITEVKEFDVFRGDHHSTLEMNFEFSFSMHV